MTRPVHSQYLLILIPIIFFANCQNNHNSSRAFEHDINSEPYPWTGNEFEAGEEDFTFAIIADLTGGEREKIFEVAVEQLNRFEPDFVLSVGDLIEGGTRDTVQLFKEWVHFNSRVNKLSMPFFYLGGNHDLSNPEMQQYWQKNIGPLYYYFLIDNVLFLMLDSEDYELERMLEIDEARAEAIKILRGEIEGDFEKTRYSQMAETKTGALSDAQQEYFEKVIAETTDVRWTFVLMHKPLYTRNDDKGLNRLIYALGDRNYTVINGHEHAFSYQRRNNNDFIMLGTTGGYQNPQKSNAFDHVTLIRMADEPVITHLRLDGILNKKGNIPLGGDTISFQASKSVELNLDVE